MSWELTCLNKTEHFFTFCDLNGTWRNVQFCDQGNDIPFLRKILILLFNAETITATDHSLDEGLVNSTLYSTSSVSMPQNNKDNEHCQMVCNFGENQTRAYSNLSTTLVLSVTPVVGIGLLTFFVFLITILIKIRSKHHKSL